MTVFSIHLRKQVDDPRTYEDLLKEALYQVPVFNIQLCCQSIDARKKNIVWLEYQLSFEADPHLMEIKTALKSKKIKAVETPAFKIPEQDISVDKNPFIVGFGPSGMFLALQLARLGLQPIVLEQGEQVEKRWESVQALWQKGELNPLSNMHFGEGGAGTFSDGKLTAGKRHILHQTILEEFHRLGGPEDILYKAKPHLGTDYLQKVVANMRQEILSLGGRIRFGHCLEDIRVENGRIKGAVINGEYHPLQQLFLCPGNSARPLFRMLFTGGVAMKAKPMAVGLRVEHPRNFIDTARYGKWKKFLPSAEYKLTAQVQGRGVYSFCMCPGGFIICTATEQGGQCTNGMSYHSRLAPCSNSALVVSVSASDFPSAHPLSGIEFQKQLEQAFYFSPRIPFTAPVQRCADFLSGQLSAEPIVTSYKPEVIPKELGSLLPQFLTTSLKEGLLQFEKKIPGFIKHGILVGVESRTSSPVCILRNENCESINTKGLYVFGEGAGYAGGIMTSSLDTYKFSLRIKGG